MVESEYVLFGISDNVSLVLLDGRIVGKVTREVEYDKSRLVEERVRYTAHDALGNGCETFFTYPEALAAVVSLYEDN